MQIQVTTPSGPHASADQAQHSHTFEHDRQRLGAGVYADGQRRVHLGGAVQGDCSACRQLGCQMPVEPKGSETEGLRLH